MPALTLQVVSIDAAPVGQRTLHSFDDSGGSIGRDESNFLALPDKHRRVSRLHATISFPGGTPTITNSSTSLPLSVGEQQLDGGESMPITQGALIEIGPYILQAHLEQVAAAAATPAMIRRDAQPTALPFSPPVAPAAYSPAMANDLLGSDPLLNWSGVEQGASSLSPAPTAVNGLGDFWPESGSSAQAPPPSAEPSNGSFFAASPSPMAAAAPLQYAAPSPPSLATDPFADLLAGIGGSPSHPPNVASRDFGIPQQTQAGMSADPLAAFGGAPATSFASGASGSSSTQLGSRGPAPGGLIPDDFNPFHMPSSAIRNAADPLADLIGGSTNGGAPAAAESTGTPSIDSLFQAGSTPASDASLFGFGPTSRGGDGTIAGLIRSESASDPLSFFDSIEPAPTPMQLDRPMRDNSMEVGSAFKPPLANVPGTPDRSNQSSFPAAAAMFAALPENALAGAVPANVQHTQAMQQQAPLSAPAFSAHASSAAVRSDAPSARQVTPATAPSAAAATPDALTEAFLRGAGLAPRALPHGLTPEIMTIIGSLLRSATAGAVDMLAARAATKREVQASVTIISVQANNPLKFLPNADAALLQLLGKKMPGFMRADVAMRDAFDDLRAHEVGVIAGTRAALTEVLGKFDPAVLGDKLAKGSVLESLMPSARKAKLWDMYLERYLQIRREAEDDFQSIFGRAFVQAYERETARIKGESPMAGG